MNWKDIFLGFLLILLIILTTLSYLITPDPLPFLDEIILPVLAYFVGKKVIT